MNAKYPVSLIEGSKNDPEVGIYTGSEVTVTVRIECDDELCSPEVLDLDDWLEDKIEEFVLGLNSPENQYEIALVKRLAARKWW